MVEKVNTPEDEQGSTVEEMREEETPIVEIISNEEPVGEEVQNAHFVDAESAKKPGRPDGVTLIAIYYFLAALPGLLLGLLIVGIPIPAVVLSVSDTIGLTAAMFGLGLAVLLTAGSGALMLLTAVGLLFCWNWARWLAIAFAMLSLLLVPVGTVIGGVIIAYLLSENIRRVFEAS
jgi:hypothetical protein